MKKFWFVFLCCTLIVSCKNSKSKSSSHVSLIPENTQLIIKINSTEGLENGLKNNALIQTIKNYTRIEEFSSLLIPLNKTQNNNNLIAVSKNENDSLDISFIIPISKNGISTDSITELKIDSSYVSNQNIQKFYFNNNSFYSTIIDSTLFISNKLELTKKASNKKKTDHQELETLLNTSDTKKMVSICYNHKNGNIKPIIFNDTTLNNKQFSNYTMIDSDISQNSILINGITKASDSTKSLINIFKHTIPQENQIPTITPATIDYFKSVTFDNYDIFHQNLIKHQFQDSTTTHEALQNVVEIGQIKKKGQEAIILKSIDPSHTLENLNVSYTGNEFRSVVIYELENSNSILNSFNPILKSKSLNENVITISDFIIFSDDISFLKSIISNYQNNTTLSEDVSYKNLKQDLSDESSLLIFGNSTELNAILNTNFTDDKKLNPSQFKTSAIQYVYDTNFAHVNAVFKTHKNKTRSNSVNEELNISIDADLLSKPQLIKNHTNNQMDIVVQDVNNNLYLISNTGKVFWKKQLNDKIIGDIKQIDIYKNGRLQLVFNTSKRLYVLDRNGNEVKPFPLSFNTPITQPASVFDYDKKKNYRLMITQGKSVSMYDKNGKIVTGFTYKSAQNTISSQPKHFRIGRKDYIVFAHGNKIEILDRVGRKRVTAKENISFSENEIYLYNNRFTTSNTNGELLEINQSGHVNHKNLNANSEHKIATTSKTLVVLNDNKLTIKSKTIELDFGDYTAPKIFYINDKLYITVTDLQSKRGYLFDSQAKPIANFPVYANSQLELNNIDRDNALEVITKGDNDAIIVYEIR
ncbi:ribonuclease HII [uncultured Psychroserpens sp.]|uniref:ribonuclease HII n=1 Tax=uncultured Psychroserpens sp. TaxID=255436 RepID=UPI002625DF00|nr:ribonuclease HII [uncultured Psychroserpens sp.]